MGWFSKNSDKPSSNKDKSGSKGDLGKGYGKGSAASNPKKWTARTEAQEKRSDRAVDKWKG
jgi:hypothetical protein